METARITEHALRLIWQSQRFSTSALHTNDGLPVTIISPGHPNVDSGPDFLEARIRIGSTLYCGDVELHCDAGSWWHHRHDTDARYNRVILHVVVTKGRLPYPARTQSKRTVPLLVLQSVLRPAAGRAPEPEPEYAGPIVCWRVNSRVPVALLTSWLLRLADERLQLRIERYEWRLKQLVEEQHGMLCEPYRPFYGNLSDIPCPGRTHMSADFRDIALWEQLLYEAIMESLGYEKNREPFLALARAVPLKALRWHGLHNVRSMMALLFGQGGLLPSVRTIHDRESRRYLRELKRQWRLLLPHQKYPLIHASRWLFFRLRPQNFPSARLAAFCFILPTLFGKTGFSSLIQIFQSEHFEPVGAIQAVRSYFSFAPDCFWLHHYHFRSSRGGTGIVLGKPRVGDMVINCIIPIVLLYGEVFGNLVVRKNARLLYTMHPPLQQNSITKTVQQYLLGEALPLRTARLQQGAIQLYRSYCTKERCGECAISSALGETAEPKVLDWAECSPIHR